MPQEQHVVRCYACKKFQVQIVKKVPKWQCKVCSEKQSLMKVYAQGSGKDCRLHVQNLNMQQGILMSQETPDYESTALHCEDEPFYNTDSQVVHTKASKWSDYLDDNGPTQALAKSWKDEETSENLPSNILRGRKRRLSNPDNYEDYYTNEQSCQPDAEVLDLSSGSCASDILRNLHMKQEVTQHPSLPHSSTFSGFTSSKWSQYVSPRDPPPTDSNENQTTLTNGSKERFIATAAFNKGVKSAASTMIKNPFNATDDDNLDSLLDF